MKTTFLSTIISGTGLAVVLFGAVSTSRADYATEVLAQQPLTYWRFSESGPMSFVNVATNLGSLGTAQNGTYSDPGLMMGRPGALAGTSDTAAGFVGTFTKIDVPFNAAINPGSFTVECWAKVMGGSGTYRSPVTSRENTSSVSAGYMFYAVPGNTWAFWTGSGTGWNTIPTYSTNGPVVIGQWTHLVGTYDASTLLMSFYINGTLVGVRTNTTVMPVGTSGTARPFRVGAGATEGTGNYWFNGSIDEVAVYGNVLTADQVNTHYWTAITNGAGYASGVQSSQPVLYLRLDELNANPRAANQGSLGATADGIYGNGMQPTALDLVAPAYPGLPSSNLGLVFDMSGKYVWVGQTNIPVPWTMSCWVNRQDDTNASSVLMISSASGLKLEQYEGAVNVNRRVGFTAYGVADNSFNYSAPAGTWVHLAFVGTPTGTLLYTNGFLCDSNPATISLPMRSIASPTSDRINGSVDEVATFNRALLGGQVATLYLTAIGDVNRPAFLNDVPIVSPAGTIYATTPFTLSIDVYGAGPLSYQWRHDGTVVGTARDYAKANASLADNGNYDVIVNNAYGSVTSSIVNVTINPAVPPTIGQAPASRAIYSGGNAVFSATVSGTPPLTYQWKHAGTNLPGATGLALIVTNCGTAQTGAYAIAVTNVAGGIISPTATLSFRTPTPGSYEAGVVANAPVAYWRFGETTGTTAFDYAGAHDATIFSSVTLGAPGPASPAFAGLEANNTAFTFNATDSGVQAGSLGLPGPISVVAWINPGVLTGDKAIVGENASWYFKTLGSELRLTTPGIRDHNSSGAGLKLNEWQQVAVTFQPGAAGGAKFYVNGRYISSADASSLTPGTSYLWIGTNQWTGQVFNGGIDEVALYNTILTADAIATMYNQALYGTTTPPLVLQSPASETVALGLPATFKVVAGGSPPLAYQWNKGGTPLPGATGAVLYFAAVTFADAAQYSVTVTNKLGTANSVSATLTVLPQPSFALLTNDLVVHLTFDTDFKDSSGRLNDAYPMGNPALVAGKLGQAARLRTDTVTSTFQYLYFFSTADVLFSASDSFSISLWLKYTTPFNDLPIIGNAHKSTYNTGWVLTEEGGQFEWVADDGTVTVAADPVGGPMINDGVWHQLAVVFDRTNAVANSYVDGRLVDTRSIATLGSVDSGLQLQPIIGQDDSGTYPTVFGSSMTATFDLDDLGIWRRVLSPYEVLSLYNAAQGAGQSFDKYGPIKLNIGMAGATMVIGWQAGTLESNTDLKNANGWAPVTGATAPLYTVPSGTGTIFYRVRQ